ncbi:MAG: acetyl esterase/lipase [Arenicella sp.]|jgi:acetyl esterase/lipase
MIISLLKNTVSMIASPTRMPGRSWLTELVVRTARGLFTKGQQKGLPWLRQAIDTSAGYHPALAKVSSNTRDIAGVPCMLVSPKQGATSDTVIVYFHGGGYIAGSPRGHKTILAQLALDTKGLIVAPDYRLAPEHPFPAPQDDCLAVASLVLKTYEQKRVTLAGDSAGGALAIATALQLANVAPNQIDKLVLISPWVDPTATEGSIITNEKNDFLSAEFLKVSFDHLMQGQDLENDQVNFLNTALASLPKTLVQCGKGEMFYDQIVEFSQRAKDQGVDLEFQPYRAQFHVFHVFSALLKDAEDALSKIAKFVNKA